MALVIYIIIFLAVNVIGYVFVDKYSTLSFNFILEPKKYWWWCPVWLVGTKGHYILIIWVIIHFLIKYW